ncbi:DUF6300 family protein [Streptomyces sp. bgisy031]|uniref:DUF6300 family protein n=1 Tax=Streptomyces sp. bgisy031 TaxID=3413772 RepID=UPI003D704D8A
MTEPADEHDVIVQLEGVEACPACGEQSTLKVSFVLTWTNMHGEVVSGPREAVLCPECDRGDPAADELLALFAVDETLGINNIETFGALIAAWVESVRHQKADETPLAEEHD